MALILRKLRDLHPEAFTDEHDYSVLSGNFTVGRITAIHGGQQDGRWRWAINGVFAAPDVMDINGMSDSLDAAKAELAANWRKWLAWAGLREL